MLSRSESSGTVRRLARRVPIGELYSEKVTNVVAHSTRQVRDAVSSFDEGENAETAACEN